MERVVLAVLATYGFGLSLESTRIAKRLAGEARQGNLQAIGHFTQTRYARLFGPRNSELGLAFYPAVAAVACLGTVGRPRFFLATLLASGASLAVSIYLLWALFIRLRVPCRVCLKAHATNLAIFVTLIRMRPRKRAV